MNRNTNRVHNELIQRFEEGDTDAGLRLSEYLWGHSDRKGSLEITRKLAEEYHIPRAMNNLGWILETGGDGIRRNRRLSYRWYCTAACAGDALAMSNIADKCLFDKDAEYTLKGFSFAFTAAEMGEKNATLTMAYCFMWGHGAVRNLEAACDYLEGAGFKPGDPIVIEDRFGVTKTCKKEEMLRSASTEMKERILESPFIFKPIKETVWVHPGLKCYPEVFENLQHELESRDIPFRLLPGKENRKHVWARDYMPLQVGKRLFLQQTYSPDYLKDTLGYIPDVSAIVSELNLKKNLKSDLVIDGGNVIMEDRNVIMTDKVFWENPGKDQKVLYELLTLNLHADRITFIPWDMTEPYGHADGMVRFVNGCTVVINNFSNTDPEMHDRLVGILSKHYIVKELNFDGPLTKKYDWGYINFLKVGSRLFVPQFGIQEDAQAIGQLGEIYRGCEIIPIFGCERLAKDGGVLNCVTWTVKE